MSIQNVPDRYLECDGAHLRWRLEGRGPAIALLHGWALDLEYWDPVAARLALQFTVLRFDDDPPGMDVVYVEHIRSATYLEKPPDIDRHVEQFETISARALSPEKTRDLFITLAHDLWEH